MRGCAAITFSNCQRNHVFLALIGPLKGLDKAGKFAQSKILISPKYGQPKNVISSTVIFKGIQKGSKRRRIE